MFGKISPRIRSPLDLSWLPKAILLAGIIFSVYLFLRIEDDVFFGGDSGLKWLMVKQFGTGAVSPYLTTPQPDWVLQLWQDGFAPFAPPFAYDTPKGYLFAFPIWFPLLSTPFFLMFGARGVYLLPTLALWVLWWRMSRLCHTLRKTPAMTAFVLCAVIFASPITVYGAIFWEHTLAVALAFCGMEYYFTRRQSSGLHAGLCGSLCALAVWFRPEALILLGLLGGLLGLRCVRTRDPGARAFLIGSLLVLSAFFIANSVLYAHPLGAHSFQVFDRDSFLTGKLTHLTRIWAAFQPQLVRTFPLILWFLALAIPDMWTQRRAPHRIGSYLVLFGFYALVPWFLPNAGGRQWGPRYLLILIPPLIMLMASQLEYVGTWRSPRLKILAVVCCLACLGVGAVVNSYYGGRIITADYRHRVRPLLQELRRTDTAYIAIDSQYIQQELTALYGERTFFLVQGSADLRRVAEALKARGISDILFITFWQPQPPQFVLRNEAGERVAEFRHQGSYGDYDVSRGTL